MNWSYCILSITMQMSYLFYVCAGEGQNGHAGTFIQQFQQAFLFHDVRRTG